MIKKIVVLSFIFFSISFAQLLSPKISVQHTEYDFGDIKQNAVVSHDFILTNNGGSELKILDVKASCGCTAVEPDKKTLAPGESTKLKVTFNSSGRRGTQTKHVTVKTNDPSKSKLILTIKSNILLNSDSNVSSLDGPRIHFKETQHNFGKVIEGKVVDHTFSFTNEGKNTLEIKDVKTSCGCTAALVSSPKIGPGSKGTLRIELDTSNRQGRMSRTVTIMSNDPTDPQKVLTLYAEIVKE